MSDIDLNILVLNERIEELEAHCKRLRLEAAHANDTADAAIERAKELEAKLPEQIEWVKRLADDLIAAEGREARLKDKLAKAVEDAEKYARAFAAQSRKLQAVLHIEGVKGTLAELTGQNDD